MLEIFMKHLCCWWLLVNKSSLILVTPWTEHHQAPLSLGFSRQEYWSGEPFSSLGDLPNPGIEFTSPELAGEFLTMSHQGSPHGILNFFLLSTYDFLPCQCKNYSLSYEWKLTFSILSFDIQKQICILLHTHTQNPTPFTHIFSSVQSLSRVQLFATP